MKLTIDTKTLNTLIKLLENNVYCDAYDTFDINNKCYCEDDAITDIIDNINNANKNISYFSIDDLTEEKKQELYDDIDDLWNDEHYGIMEEFDDEIDHQYKYNFNAKYQILEFDDRYDMMELLKELNSIYGKLFPNDALLILSI